MATAFGLDAERVAQLQQQQAFWTSQLPPPGPVVSVPHAPDDPAVVDRLLAALHRDGVVILERAVDLATVSLLRAEVNLHVQHARPGTTEQLGANTKRLGAVVARAGERCYPLVAHPVLMEVCSAVLGQQALNIERADLEEEMEWSCHLTQLIEVGPGAGVQPLHSDGGAWAYDFKREIEHSLSTMWALDDSWTDQGGATRFILGSHRWPPERFGHHEEAVAAAMPAGSLLIFSSAVRHGAGSNTSNKPRLGLNVDYNLQFLRQEEAQQLSNPETINRESRALPSKSRRALPSDQTAQLRTLAVLTAPRLTHRWPCVCGCPNNCRILSAAHPAAAQSAAAAFAPRVTTKASTDQLGEHAAAGVTRVVRTRRVGRGRCEDDSRRLR
jgi:ectoine hydroxylase-related dioxygenase (phytanoyl-CoA dioxygenase family)